MLTLGVLSLHAVLRTATNCNVGVHIIYIVQYIHIYTIYIYIEMHVAGLVWIISIGLHIDLATYNGL